jgi:hypothetical protein
VAALQAARGLTSGLNSPLAATPSDPRPAPRPPSSAAERSLALGRRRHLSFASPVPSDRAAPLANIGHISSQASLLVTAKPQEKCHSPEGKISAGHEK